MDLEGEGEEGVLLVFFIDISKIEGEEEGVGHLKEGRWVNFKSRKYLSILHSFSLHTEVQSEAIGGPVDLALGAMDELERARVDMRPPLVRGEVVVDHHLDNIMKALLDHPLSHTG